MIEIKDLLLKFNTILLSEEVKKESVKNIISNTIGVKINSEDIAIKRGTIYLNIKPIYKNEIFIKMNQINQQLEVLFGKKSPKEIR